LAACTKQAQRPLVVNDQDILNPQRDGLILSIKKAKKKLASKDTIIVGRDCRKHTQTCLAILQYYQRLQRMRTGGQLHL
jgi:hypothetical protein